MTNTTNRRAERERSHLIRWIASTAGAIAIVAASAMAITAQGSPSSPITPATRETNSMGMPVIATPGVGSGSAEIAGLTATPSK